MGRSCSQLEGRVRDKSRMRGGRVCVRGGEQRLCAVPGGAVLLARMPARGLEGAQAGVRSGPHELKVSDAGCL